MIKVSITIDPRNQMQREALDKLLDAVGGLDPKIVESVKKKTVKLEKETPQIETPKKEVSEQIKIEAVRAVLATKVTQHREVIKSKLTELGANNVTALATSNYQTFLDFLNEL